ncbi:tetratricopeptide repeat protein [Reichenbachiella ulvae]|uniref:Tetratricopeptide repeat protein n=1 Tax=Reichenbachiella ulvae TaxID=2980104 RepID=A0ABT3CU34_9BACT|nr:tetratricopeptide repeat protein [Reichenbachiella ulvae]MCV9386743.1 tetratricopeptide repeat protein [Reichenbachiella ulvae]
MKKDYWLIVAVVLILCSVEIQAQEASKAKILVESFVSPRQQSDQTRILGETITLGLKNSISLGGLYRCDQSSGNRMQNSYSYSYDTLRYDYVIRGEFFVTTYDFFIKTSIVRVGSTTDIIVDQTYLSPKTGKLEDVLMVVHELSKDIQKKIAVLEKEKKSKAAQTVKVIGVVASSSSDAKSNKFYQKTLDQVNYVVSQRLQDNTKMRFKKYDELSACQFKPFDPVKLILDHQLNALIQCEYSLDEALNLTLKAKLFFGPAENEQTEVSLVPLSLNLNQDVESIIASHIENSLGLILTDGGQWNVEEINKKWSLKHYKQEYEQYMEAEAYSSAVAIAQKAITEYGRDAEINRQLANALVANRQVEQSIPVYTKATEIDPKDELAWSGLADSYFAMGNNKKALEAYEKAIKLDPENKAYLYSVGRILYFQEQYEEAIEYLEKANLRSYDELIYLASAYNHTGSYDKAIDIYYELFSEYPSSEEIRDSFLDTYLRKAEDDFQQPEPDYNVIIAYLQDAIAYFEDPNVYQYLLAAYNRSMQFDDARVLIAEAIEEGYLKPEVYFYQANDLRDMKDENGNHSLPHHEQAIYFLKKYQQYDNKAYVNQRIGGTYFRLQQYDSAIVYYKIALKKDNRPGNYLNLAELLTMQGQYEESSDNCRAVQQTKGLGNDEISNGYRAIALYLMVCNSYLSGDKTPDSLTQLEQLMDSQPLKLQWSFTTFRLWLHQSDQVDKKSAKYLDELSEKLQASSY